MKQILTVIFLVLITIYTCRSKNPDYKEVTEKFISTYNSPEDSGNVYKIYFAKKKDGWFVYKYYYHDSLNAERDFQLFWSNNEQLYKKLNYNLLEENANINIDDERSKYLSSYGEYNFAHCIYAGYKDWDFDIIRELETKEDLSEYELESLGRAYSNYAMGFLWSVYSAPSNENDIDRTLLPRCEFPNRQRAEKFAQYVKKGIAVFKTLETRNPYFQTMVGDIHTKLSGEYVYAYTFLSYSGYPDIASKFLIDSLYDKYILSYARNYLKFLKKDAILFTQGDLDTYPLLYIQEKFGYRKDVTVLNTGQLQLPGYIDFYSKIKPGILPSFYKDFYCCNKSDYLYTSDNTKEDNIISEKQFYNKLIELEKDCGKISPVNPVFNTSKINISTLNPGEIKLPDVMYLNDITQLILIDNNFNKIPVYFGNTIESPVQQAFLKYTNNIGMASEIVKDGTSSDYKTNYYYNTFDSTAVRTFLEQGIFKITDDAVIKTNFDAIGRFYMQYSSQLMQYVSILIYNKELTKAQDIYHKEEDVFYFNTKRINQYISYAHAKLLCDLKLYADASQIISKNLKDLEDGKFDIDSKNNLFTYYLLSTEELVKTQNLPDKKHLLARILTLKSSFQKD